MWRARQSGPEFRIERRATVRYFDIAIYDAKALEQWAAEHPDRLAGRAGRALKLPAVRKRRMINKRPAAPVPKEDGMTKRDADRRRQQRAMLAGQLRAAAVPADAAPPNAQSAWLRLLRGSPPP